MSRTDLAQALLSKRLYLKGIEVLRPNDGLAAGIAVSLFHDAAEMLMWDVLKHERKPLSDKTSFPDLLQNINGF